MLEGIPQDPDDFERDDILYTHRKPIEDDSYADEYTSIADRLGVRIPTEEEAADKALGKHFDDYEG